MTDARAEQKDAYSLILRAIDVGVYRPGDRLVESELAERFGVSRTPIREALQRLETQSLLTRDGRSLIVASLDHSQLAELYVVRAELEGLAARLAARQHRDADRRLAFDAVAGPLTHQLLDAMPDRSTVTVFSGLSKQAPSAGIDHLVFQGKSVTGFWLGPWLLAKNPLGILRTGRRAQALVPTALKRTIRERVPFEDAARAMQAYMDQMTGGKYLLKPDPATGD